MKRYIAFIDQHPIVAWTVAVFSYVVMAWSVFLIQSFDAPSANVAAKALLILFLVWFLFSFFLLAWKLVRFFRI